MASLGKIEVVQGVILIENDGDPGFENDVLG